MFLVAIQIIFFKPEILKVIAAGNAAYLDFKRRKSIDMDVKKIAEKKETILTIYNLDLFLVLAGFLTMIGGIFHLLMLGPSLKPINFPMEMLPQTDALFTASGIVQIFLAIPLIKSKVKYYHYFGLIITAGLTSSLLVTRFPNPITILPLVDTNPMAFFTTFFQISYIIVTVSILYKSRNEWYGEQK